jgi:thioesterase domain-containing protein
MLFQLEPTLGWKTLSPGEIRIHHIGGNHLSMFEEPQVEGLSEILAGCLERERARP